MSLPVNIHTHRLRPDRALQVLSADHQLFSQNLLKREGDHTFFSLSLHPMHVQPADIPSSESISALLQTPGIIAIGEAGLDKASPLTITEQLELFRTQMRISDELGMPVIIHCVGRWNELELLLKEKKAGSPAWIIHGFRKTKLAGKFLALGAYLSFGQALLYDEKLQDLLRTLPFDRIFLETDDADVSIIALYEKLAAIKSLSLQAVIDQLFLNYTTVFQHGKLA